MSKQPIYTLPTRKSIELFQVAVLDWASENLRDFPWRHRNFPNYKVIVTEILLQRTKVQTIVKFLPEFFRAFPSWKRLDEASLNELETRLRPIGLSRRRAVVLNKLSHEMVKRRGRVPCSREEIDKLPGVGQYIANAIGLLCCGKDLPLLDVNMARVLERYFGSRNLVDIRYDPYLQRLAELVVQCKNSTIINFAIIDIAHLVCTARSPKCDKCPLNKRCRNIVSHSIN